MTAVVLALLLLATGPHPVQPVIVHRIVTAARPCVTVAGPEAGPFCPNVRLDPSEVTIR